MNKREVFISYAWGDSANPEREQVVEQIEVELHEVGIMTRRDKHEFGFKGLVRDFMQELTDGYCVIVVISDKYLKSENCMFELVHIAEHADFADRIFPIVLPDAKIFKIRDRMKYARYWQEEKEAIEADMEGMDITHLDGFHEDIRLIAKIHSTIANLTDILKNMVMLSPSVLEEEGYGELIDAIKDRLAR